MGKALFILMLVVVGIFVGVIMSPPRQSKWRPTTKMVFIGFDDAVTGRPGTYAQFTIKEAPRDAVIWNVVEISHREGGKWKRREPLPFPAITFPSPPRITMEDLVRPNARINIGKVTVGLVPVETTNAPWRVVFELEQLQMSLKQPPAGKVAQFFWDLRMRWRQFRYPNNPLQWVPRGPLFYMTNEFNFATGANAAGK